MFTVLKNWNGSIDINGSYVKNDDIAKIDVGQFSTQPVHIVLHPKTAVVEKQDVTEYRITVKRYMTKKASPEFDFMEKWNKNIPMPLCTMTGIVIKETRGMVYMKLHGDIWAEKIHRCMKCGKVLTNPVSQYFGIGPECGGHNYVNPFNTDAELKEAVGAYKKQLQNTTWEGWIIKSAITEQVEV